jgi:hypothetical protein
LADLRAEVQELVDREQIRDVFSRFALAMDTQDWDLLDSVFSAEAVVDHSLEGWDGPQAITWTGHDEVMRMMEEGVGRHVAAQHLITNHLVTVEGDRARAVAYLHSVHLDDGNRPDDHGDHGAWYLTRLVRTPGVGWQFSWMKHTSIWFAGAMQPGGPVTQPAIDEVRAFLQG